MTPQHRHLHVNGITMHVAEQGEGPLVLLLHGFPESWYSWRHQIPAIAEAGYHVVAPDQRGYCATDAPSAVDQYTIMHLVGDVVALIDALGEKNAVVVGHDWGAPIAWCTAQLRPDLVRGVVGLSLPPARRGPVPPLVAAREEHGDDFYVLHFQEPGFAESWLGKDLATTFRGVFTGTEATDHEAAPSIDRDVTPGSVSAAKPSWITDADLAVIVDQYATKGFAGGLNWYRNIDRNWELMAPWQDALITPPALYVVGDRDNVRTFCRIPTLERMRALAPALRDVIEVPDCGHWTQQERPNEVNDAIVSFLRQLPPA
ncbi:Pimeloyl-ACP methyl ester carboxylesterase [Parafrankia irregularis]|uniref:Pimeloyl-ACP methyl ester carboxylesterase n=1 Tax=Parafrankia irregularis TaxID=795642 RepID=A0A0S4QUL1_9ACTN|nr:MULTISPECIES: alpha/beta hydrolase [Parafrankia]MBE3199953.1 alpha/beta hydrolase [Parafrankia sp. CH37]CUU59303.1 Pimeloyl-ACP methyl ester carboxylesterase [Parafrankia irregularis]